MKNPLIKGNCKMGPRVYLFNLPPVKTCSPTKWCLKGRDGKPACYALRNNFILPHVIQSAETRLAFTQSEDFVEVMTEAIQKKRVEYFRFHSSGDFYSADYVRKVMAIAEACPETFFMTTTRQRRFRVALQKLNSLPNFVVRESLDDGRTAPTMELPYAALDHIPVSRGSGVIYCSNDCVAHDYACWTNPASMVFAEH